MKKWIALISVITCIFGLTACAEAQYTEYEQQKLADAKEYASEYIVPFMQNFMEDENVTIFDERTAEEVEAVFAEYYQMAVDGYAVKNGILSFYSAKDEIGRITSVGEAFAVIDGDQIVVNVKVSGEKKTAEAEVILSNDMFMRLLAVSLNPVSSMGELMTKAALNTLIGMGTVFAVLILISGIISAFGIIPGIQARFSGNAKVEEKKQAPVVSPASAAPAVSELQEDTELVAVIAAAIAAYEGAASADGFVVRSIRKVNRRRR